MVKLTKLVIVQLLLFISVHSKGFEISWDKSYGETGKDGGGIHLNEALYDAVELPGGGYFAVGWQYNEESKFYYDGLFIHTDALGNEISRGRVGTKDIVNIPGVFVDSTGAQWSNEYLYAIEAGPDGDLICGGYRDMREITADSSREEGSWLIRVDMDANIKWEVIVPFDKDYGDCKVNDIVSTSDGEFVAVAGELYPGKKYTSFYDDRPNDYGRVIKFTADGTVRWVKEIGPILNAGFAGFRIEEITGSSVGQYLVSGGGHGLILDATGEVTKKFNDMSQVTGHGGVWDQCWSVRQMADGRLLSIGGGTWPGSWEKYGFFAEEMNFTYYTADGERTDQELVISNPEGGWNGFGLDGVQLLDGDIALFGYKEDNYFARCNANLEVSWSDNSLTLEKTLPLGHAYRFHRIIPTSDTGFTMVGMKTQKPADGNGYDDNQASLVHFKPTLTAVLHSSALKSTKSNIALIGNNLRVATSGDVKATATLVALSGRVLKKVEFIGSTTLELEGFAQGLYITKIETPVGTKTESFILK